jgi:hypothetical protein
MKARKRLYRQPATTAAAQWTSLSRKTNQCCYQMIPVGLIIISDQLTHFVHIITSGSFDVKPGGT